MALVIFGFIAFVVATVFWLAWMVVVALFWLAWPLTLLLVAAIAWRAQSRWHRMAPSGALNPRAETARPSGNRAFDEYREDTLNRLDEERHKFGAFLERLRKSKDKEAFDRFMSERRGRNIENMRPALN